MRILEINTRVHCSSFDNVSAYELNEYARLGFDAIWFMGIWRIGEGAKAISKIISEDFEGSPYAIAGYEVNPSLGGLDGFRSLVERAHAAELKVFVDFIPNHTGLDSPWIIDHREFYIRSNPLLRKQDTGDFYLHPSGEVIAFGRDPYFEPWRDSAQIDYTSPALRRHMIAVLKWICEIADGVRCDMAMLILRDQIRKLWYPFANDAWFNEMMPREFWDEAITAVKAVNPKFIFLAEAYWDSEDYLQQLGFDLTYEKSLYDGLIGHDNEIIHGRLSKSYEYLKHSLFFLENHDEERAALILEKPDNFAFISLMLCLPGSVMIHEGQMEGRREKLPIQRIKPLMRETSNALLAGEYERILKATHSDIFKDGSFQLYDSGTQGVVSFLRNFQDRTVSYIGKINASGTSFHHTSIDLTPVVHAAGFTSPVRFTDLLTQQTLTLHEEEGGRFILSPWQIGIGDGNKFAIIEAHSV